MGTTRQLQDELKLLLGSNNVYFQPPKNLQMHYPCFTVSLGSASQAMADNKTYTYTDRYTLTYISYDPDDEMRKRVVEKFSMCTFDRHFVNDTLQHYVFSLYY